MFWHTVHSFHYTQTGLASIIYYESTFSGMSHQLVISIGRAGWPLPPHSERLSGNPALAIGSRESWTENKEQWIWFPTFATYMLCATWRNHVISLSQSLSSSVINYWCKKRRKKPSKREWEETPLTTHSSCPFKDLVACAPTEAVTSYSLRSGLD